MVMASFLWFQLVAGWLFVAESLFHLRVMRGERSARDWWNLAVAAAAASIATLELFSSPISGYPMRRYGQHYWHSTFWQSSYTWGESIRRRSLLTTSKSKVHSAGEAGPAVVEGPEEGKAQLSSP